MREGRSEEHRNCLGFFRLAFALLVIVSHAPELTDGDRHRELLTRLVGTVSFGEVAVDGFFLISGYLITQSFVRSAALSSYLVKRGARIVPGYLVAFLVSVVVFAPLGGSAWSGIGRAIPSLLAHALTLRPPEIASAFSTNAIPALNGAMWTIAYEARCYLLIAILGVTRLLHKPWLIAAAAIAAMVAFEVVSPVWYITRVDRLPGFILVFGSAGKTLKLTSMFLVGATFYLLRGRIVLSPIGGVVALVMLALTIRVPALAEAGLAVFGGYALFAYGLRAAGFLSAINNKTDISYGTYLYAWPIQQLLLRADPALPIGASMACTVGGALACGWLSWHVVEKPALQALRAMAARSRRTPRAAVVGISAAASQRLR